jgi:hypothetical protein
MKRSVVALSALVLLAASCAFGHPNVEKPPPFATPPPPPPKPAAHIGQTLDLMRIGAQKIAVTLDQVINPATVPNGWGDPAKNYVAAKLTIKNNGITTIVGNGNSNVKVVGSDNKTYSSDLATVTECTDFIYGWFIIAMGDSKTGCVTFALPPGVTPVKVKYTPSSGISHDVGEWLNP